MDGGQAEKRASDAGRELSRLGATQGGRARAQALTPAERSEIARRAVRARWARSGPAGNKAEPEVEPEGSGAGVGEADPVPRSQFRGRVDIGPADVECHVLSDGRRAMVRDDLLEALGGGATGNPGRRLSRLPTVPEGMLADRVIGFRVAGDTDLAAGYEVGLLVELSELVLAARSGGLLKKKQLPLASTAEAIVRHCAPLGVVELVDRAIGYDKVRTRQGLQLRLQAMIADETEAWVSIVPAEFWAQLARLEGMPVVPDQPLMRWTSYVLAFVYDAIEPDLGRELRREGEGEPFSPDLHQWLHATGRKRLASRMRQTIVTMNHCSDMAEFRSAFAKVLHKRPLQLELLDDRR